MNLDLRVWFATTMTLICKATRLFHAAMVCFPPPTRFFSRVDCYPIETCLEKIADRECTLECGENETVEKETGYCSDKCGPSLASSSPPALISSSRVMLSKA